MTLNKNRNYERWTWHERGTKKNSESRQESNPWPPEHMAGAHLTSSLSFTFNIFIKKKKNDCILFMRCLNNVLPNKWLKTREHGYYCLLRQLDTLWKFLFYGDSQQIGTTTPQKSDAGLSKVLLKNKITDYITDHTICLSIIGSYTIAHGENRIYATVINLNIWMITWWFLFYLMFFQFIL